MTSRNRNKKKKLRARLRKKLIESTRIGIAENLIISLRWMERACEETKTAFMELALRLPESRNGF